MVFFLISWLSCVFIMNRVVEKLFFLCCGKLSGGPSQIEIRISVCGKNPRLSVVKFLIRFEEKYTRLYHDHVTAIKCSQRVLKIMK